MVLAANWGVLLRLWSGQVDGVVMVRQKAPTLQSLAPPRLLRRAPRVTNQASGLARLASSTLTMPMRMAVRLLNGFMVVGDLFS